MNETSEYNQENISHGFVQVKRRCGSILGIRGWLDQ